MILRQLFDKESSTYTYLLADEKTKEAVLIDTVIEQTERDLKLVKELGLTLKYLLETHIHADHITGVSKIKEHFPEVKSVVHYSGGAECADILVRDGDIIKIGETEIKVIETPGHTSGDNSYYADGKVFTGDTLLVRGCGRTDFQQGSAESMYDSITRKLFSLPEETLIYPGHDYKGFTCTSVFEEKKFNPRVAGKSKEEFTEIMNNLNLAHPKKILESVPANLKCGKVTKGE